MNRCNRLLILFLFLGNYSHAQYKTSQNDYVVTFKEDTIYGRLQKYLIGRAKLETDTGTITCDPRKIYSYYIASRRQLYRALTVPDQDDNAWALVLEDGPIVLYEYKSMRSQTATYFYNGKGFGSPPVAAPSGLAESWFASREGVGLVQLLGPGSGSLKKRKMRMQILVSDDPEILKTFLEMEDYSYFELQTLIRKYNERLVMRHATEQLQSPLKDPFKAVADSVETEN